MKLETVKVKAGNQAGFRVINRRDFDPKRDTEYTEKRKVRGSE